MTMGGCAGTKRSYPTEEAARQALAESIRNAMLGLYRPSEFRADAWYLCDAEWDPPGCGSWHLYTVAKFRRRRKRERRARRAP
jgi:hypothetical protein